MEGPAPGDLGRPGRVEGHARRVRGPSPAGAAEQAARPVPVVAAVGSRAPIGRWTAATEHLRSLQWSEPGALSKDWISQYQTFGAGNGVMGGTFSNVTGEVGLQLVRLNPTAYVPAATPITSPPWARMHACCGVAHTVDGDGSPILLADRAHAVPESDPEGSIQTFAARPRLVQA